MSVKESSSTQKLDKVIGYTKEYSWERTRYAYKENDLEAKQKRRGDENCPPIDFDTYQPSNFWDTY